MLQVGRDNKLHRCFTTLETQIVLKELDGVVRGHFATYIIVKKTLDVGYWWPILFKDTHDFCKSYDSCQGWRTQNKEFGQVGNNTSRGTFYEVLGLDFIGPIKLVERLMGNKYILVAIDSATNIGKKT
jgi:hypothetical protein